MISWYNFLKEVAFLSLGLSVSVVLYDICKPVLWRQRQDYCLSRKGDCRLFVFGMWVVWAFALLLIHVQGCTDWFSSALVKNTDKIVSCCWNVMGELTRMGLTFNKWPEWVWLSTYDQNHNLAVVIKYQITKGKEKHVLLLLPLHLLNSL